MARKKQAHKPGQKSTRKLVPEADVVGKPFRMVGHGALVADLQARLARPADVALYTDNVSGAGKTTVAADVVDNDAFKANFPDGILWARIGPTPDPVGVLNRWADALKVDMAGTFKLDDRRERMRAALAERRCLLILDDACTQEIIDSLRIGGPACAHLLTTRSPALAQAFAGPDAVPLPPLDLESAYSLFRRIATDAADADPRLARELCSVVGNMPLPVSIIAGYVDGDWMRELEVEVEGGSPEQRMRQLLLQLRGKARSGAATLRQVLAIILHLLPKSAQAGFYAHGALAPKPAGFSGEVQTALLGDNEEAIFGILPLNLVDFDYANPDMLWLQSGVAEAARPRTQSADYVNVEAYYFENLRLDRRDWGWVEVETYDQVRHIMRRVARQPAELMPWVDMLIGYWGRRGIGPEAEAWARQALAVAQAEAESTGNYNRLAAHAGLLYLALADWEAAAAFFAAHLARPGDEAFEPGPPIDAELLRTWQPFLFRAVGAIFRIDVDEEWMRANVAKYTGDPAFRPLVQWVQGHIARREEDDDLAANRSARWLARIIVNLVQCQWNGIEPEDGDDDGEDGDDDWEDGDDDIA